jgi:carbonic anhydrase
MTARRAPDRRLRIPRARGIATALLLASAIGLGAVPPSAQATDTPAPRSRDRAGETVARVHQEIDSARLDALNMRIADLLSRQQRESRVTPRGDLVIRVRPMERTSATTAAAPPAVRPPAGATAPSGRTGAAKAPADPAAARPVARASASGIDPAAMTVAAARLSAQPPPGPASADGQAGWRYDGERGPEHWASLHPSFARCASGSRQSPINIRGSVQVDLEPIGFDYRPVAFSVLDTGHTVSARLAPGNALTVMGRRYELVEFHFHRPAEERIDGRVFDMSAHLVHQDAEGRRAVVTVLLERGEPHPTIQAVWNSLPLERGEPLAAPAPLDPGTLLPASRGYFTYMGSRTTPPCDEGVLWMVMKEPVTISAAQIAIFSRLYPMNARPLQALGGRLIKESN